MKRSNKKCIKVKNKQPLLELLWTVDEDVEEAPSEVIVLSKPQATMSTIPINILYIIHNIKLTKVSENASSLALRNKKYSWRKYKF